MLRRMGEPAPRIVPLSQLGDPLRLEPLARRIFGDGDRPAGWFGRKLRREWVDAALSPVAMPADTTDDDLGAALGYVLVGTPLSRGDAVRTAGTGVDPRARGTGLGARLLDAAAQWVAQAGYQRIELLADEAVRSFYEHRGFSRVRATVTTLAFGRCEDDDRLCRASPWRTPQPHEHAPVTWLPETWDGTEPAARAGLRWEESAGTVHAWLSREGTAWLVQHLVAPVDLSLTVLAAALLERLPAGAPVLLPLLPADDAATAQLLESEWSAIQRGALMEREIPSPGA